MNALRFNRGQLQCQQQSLKKQTVSLKQVMDIPCRIPSIIMTAYQTVRSLHVVMLKNSMFFIVSCQAVTRCSSPSQCDICYFNDHFYPIQEVSQLLRSCQPFFHSIVTVAFYSTFYGNYFPHPRSFIIFPCCYQYQWPLGICRKVLVNLATHLRWGTRFMQKLPFCQFITAF